MLTKLRSTWQAAGWSRCWFYLPLWLTLWNAPMPWIHRHELNEAHVDADLDRHLRIFHQASPSQQAATWHWHLALLCQMVSGRPHSTEEGCPSPHWLIEDQCPCLNSSPDLPSQPTDQPCLDGPIRMDLLAASDLAFRIRSQASGDSGHFLQTFPKAPLRDLLSVIRC